MAISFDEFTKTHGAPVPTIDPQIKRKADEIKANLPQQGSDGGVISTIDKTLTGIAPYDAGKNIIKNAYEGAKQVNEGIGQVVQGVNDGTLEGKTDPSVFNNTARGALNITGGALNALFSPATGLLKTGADYIEKPLKDAAGSNVGETVEKGANWFANLLTDSKVGPALQKFAVDNPNAEEVFNNIMSTVMGATGLEKGGEALDAIRKGADSAGKNIEKVTTPIEKTISSSIGTEKIAAIKDAIIEKLPLNDVPGKIVRRIQDSAAARAEIKAMPEPVQTAIKTDIPAPQATLVHEANPAEKAAMSSMLDKQEVGTKKLVMEPEERPDAIIGEHAMKTVKFLEDQKKAAMLEEGQHVKNLTGKDIDFTQTRQTFDAKLKSLGVEIGDDEKLDFKNSELSTPASAKDRALLQLTSDELRANEDGKFVRPATEVHTIRQRLFNEIQNKNFTEPFTKKIASIVHNDQGSGIRSGLLRDIREQAGGTGKGYEATVTRNAKIQDALQTFYKLIGKDAKGRETNIQNLGVGEVANRLEGNGSAKIEHAFQKIEDLAEEYGYKNDVSIRKLVAFKTMLKNIVGETQHNGLAGQIQQGAKAAISDAANVAGNAASHNILGTVKAVGDFIRGNTSAEQVRALRDLLKNEKTFNPSTQTPTEQSRIDSGEIPF